MSRNTKRFCNISLRQVWKGILQEQVYMACGLEKSKIFELTKRAITQKIMKQKESCIF